MMKNNGTVDVIIQDKLNTLLKEYGINLSTYTNLEFIVRINNFLATFSQKIIEKYSWKRFGYKFKPMLYLQGVNRILKYNASGNCFVSQKPQNLDFYLK
ncbi:hypothetical protein LCGC14_1754880 [marine sediment metagenome]|uniref:Uncharacterized protein n=1 Tax=marine sediment metagenome TaxID=412755 RepID=A0A0F9K2D9_9ZZZZ